MADPTITVPDPAPVNQESEAEATWSGTPPTSDVTIVICDNTTTPPTEIASRLFKSGDPFKIKFTPTHTGPHEVKVTWRDGAGHEEEDFQVS